MSGKSFNKGDRVMPTDEGVRCGVAKAQQRGEVTAIARSSEDVLVRLDGRKVARTYRQKFWTHDRVATDKPKEPGRVAYVAYCESSGVSLVSGAALPAWIALNPEIRSAWNAAASAVAEEAKNEARDEAEHQIALWRSSLEHMRQCGDCAQDSWNTCEGGRAALRLLGEKIPGEESEQ